MSKIVKLFFAVALATGVAACAKQEMPAKGDALAEQNISTKKINIGGDKMYVLLKTNKGDIVLELDAKNAPQSVGNFIQYVKDGNYAGTIFHRVIKGFMVQGGGMDEKMQSRQTRAPIANEADNGLKNNKYTVAMARTGVPDSATAQFFINTNDNDFLNFKSKTTQGWGYAVFGKVVSGQKVVDAIDAVPTASKYPYDDVPVQPVFIEKAEVLEDYKAAA